MQLPALSIQQPNVGNALLMAEKIKGLRSERETDAKKQALRLQMFAKGGKDAYSALEEGGGPTTKAAASMDAQDDMLPDSKLFKQYMAMDPKGAKDIATTVKTMNEEQRKELDRKNEQTANLLIGVMATPEQQRPLAYAQALQIARQNGLPVDSAPKYWGPGAEQWANLTAMRLSATKDVLNATQKFEKVKTAKGIKLVPSFKAAGMEPGDPGPLVEFGDPSSPTGTRYGTRSEAVGQPGKPPSGLDMEFGPDGKLRKLTTGRKGGAGAGDVPGLGKAGSNKIDDALIQATSNRMQLEEIRQSFRPEFLEIPTRLGIAWTELQAKGGGWLGKASEENKRLVNDFVKMRASTGQLFTQILKSLSGVAVNPTEYKRAEIFIPNAGTGITDGDSPPAFKSKMDRFTRFNNNAIARLAYTKSHGLNFDDVDLDDMPKIISKRGDELAKKFEENGLSGDRLKSAVREQLAREFGLVGR